MDSHSLPRCSLGRLMRASLLSFIALELWAGCTSEEGSNTRKSSGAATTTNGGGSTTTGPGVGTTTGTATAGTTGATSTGTGGAGTGSGGSGSGTGAAGSATGAGGAGTGSGATGTGAGGSSTGGAGPGTGSGGTNPPPGGGAPDASMPPGTPPGAEKIIGIDFLQRIVGKWSGTNQSGPLNAAFPMTVDFAPTSASFMFGKLQLDPQNTVVWGFNIETYGGKDVLAYRNGGFLAGAKRDTRLQLVEYDTARGYYRFCAVKEQGFPVDGCNYIDARYTFSAPDKMLFDVTTKAGKPHVHWDATRSETHVLPDPFPASIVSQGQGEAPWPPGAGL